MFFSILLLIVYFAGTASSITLAYIAYRRPPCPGRLPFIFMMIGITVWVLFSAVHLMAVSLDVKLIFINLQYIGVVVVPPAWFAFTVEYTRRRWFPAWAVVLFSVQALFITLVIWTNPLHELFRSNLTIQPFGVLTTLRASSGPLFWEHSLYSYVLILGGLLFLIQDFVRSPPFYRRQLVWLIVAPIVPAVVNIAYIRGASPLSLDITPLFFLISGLGIGYSLFRYRLLDVIHVARDRLFENIADGVIVLDNRNRVVDINLAVQTYMGI